MKFKGKKITQGREVGGVEANEQIRTEEYAYDEEDESDDEEDESDVDYMNQLKKKDSD